jgi:RNA polymerase sigma factor (sigma-70 family)
MSAPAFSSTAPLAAKPTLDRAAYERFLPLIRRAAMRLVRKLPDHITIGDLIGYGWVGLMEAYQRAQPDMPQQEFEAYASYRIRGAMLDYLRTLDPATRDLRRASRKLTESIRTLTAKHNRPPEEEEIARDLDFSRGLSFTLAAHCTGWPRPARGARPGSGRYRERDSTGGRGRESAGAWRGGRKGHRGAPTQASTDPRPLLPGGLHSEGDRACSGRDRVQGVPTSLGSHAPSPRVDW